VESLYASHAILDPQWQVATLVKPWQPQPHSWETAAAAAAAAASYRRTTNVPRLPREHNTGGRAPDESFIYTLVGLPTITSFGRSACCLVCFGKMPTSPRKMRPSANDPSWSGGWWLVRCSCCGAPQQQHRHHWQPRNFLCCSLTDPTRPRESGSEPIHDAETEPMLYEHDGTMKIISERE